MGPSSTLLELRDREGRPTGMVVITDLPGQHAIRTSVTGDPALREAAVYRYEVRGVEAPVAIEPRELFDPDDANWTSGRLRTGQSVGRIRIQVIDGTAGVAGLTEIDVVAVKLEHETEYRRMLADISSIASEAVLQGFAPSALDLAPSDLPADLLYLRFAMIAAYLQDPSFEAALARVTSQPYRTWAVQQETRALGSPFPAGPAFRRAIVASGRRVAWPSGPPSLPSLPAGLVRDRTEETVDNPANQFVKFALERWRAVALQLLDVLRHPSQAIESGPLRRGQQVTADLQARLDELLAHPLFLEVGSLRRMPTSDQVLLKRAGYREIYRTFALTESGPTLAFDRPEVTDVFAASQRNIATLYEYWCFLAVVDSVGRVCGESKTARAFTVAGNGTSLTLRSGLGSKLSWSVTRGTRQLGIELFFNRTFAGGNDRSGSWSQAMRPDCSIRIRPEGSLPSRMRVDELDVWLHFDAKYRIDNLLAQLSPGAETDSSADESVIARSAKRDDLLKMHAYRDAIARTAGAYVLYPGSEVKEIRQYPTFQELLPGLGAFPLRPRSDGLSSSSEGLDQFLGDVLTHVASQVTRHERQRFWTATVHRRDEPALASSLTAPFLDEPPADTDVLLGFVRGDAQRAWIQETRQYVMRAGRRVGAVDVRGRELGARLLLLYQRRTEDLELLAVATVDHWRPATAAELIATSYPNPGGQMYFVADLKVIDQVPTWLARVDFRRLTRGTRPGTPVVATWWDVVRSTENKRGPRV